MSDPRIDLLSAEIERRFLGTSVVRRRCPDPNAHDIDCILDVLNVRESPPRSVEEFAYTRAFELFGDEPVPVFVRAWSPEESAMRPRYVGASVPGVGA